MSAATPKAIPEGTHTITLHLVVQGAGRAAEWYKETFGALEKNRIPVPGGKFMQIELWFGDTAVMLADEFPEAGIVSPLAIGGTPIVLHFATEKAAAIWRQALKGGAREVQPLQEQFWGDLYGQIIDPFGYRWGLAQHIRDVDAEEIATLAAKAFTG